MEKLRKRRPSPAMDRWPQKHQETQKKRGVSKSSGSKRFGLDPSSLQPFAAGILKKQHMTPPAAKPSAEQRRRKKHQGEEHKSWVDHAFTDKRHRLAGFDWRDCGLGPQPVGNVQQDEPLHHQENISSLPPG